MLVTIENAETLPTRKLLEAVLENLNEDKRVRFFVTRGKGGPTVQCLRVMLSRVRKKLEAKGIRRKHFRLHSEVFPSTELTGARRDCVILTRSRTDDHELLETLEDMISNGPATQLA